MKQVTKRELIEVILDNYKAQGYTDQQLINSEIELLDMDIIQLNLIIDILIQTIETAYFKPLKRPVIDEILIGVAVVNLLYAAN